jgi:putative transposase
MAYKTSATTNTVRLISYRRLSATTLALCERLRREAGRCWTDMLQAHLASRDATWLTEADLKAMTNNGRYHLHSQSIQALAEKLIANVETARTLRQQRTGTVQTDFPHHPKPYQTVTWKGQAIRLRDGHIHLPNGRGQPTLVLPLPEGFQAATIRQAELLWRADHYELALTIEHSAYPPLRTEGQTAGIDLGEIHIAAVCTQGGQALVINGRLLRHHKQLRNKRHAAYQSRLDRCRKGSRRFKRLAQQKARASAKLYRQQRNHLHQASRKLVDFAVQQSVTYLAIGDVRGIADGVKLGTKSNQKISQWPHGQYANITHRGDTPCATCS